LVPLTAEEVLAELRSHADAKARAGQAHFGIVGANALGINIPTLRAIAKRAGRDHALAEALWQSRIHEARVLAGRSMSRRR
jgi:3-methyladenine DNA glycosylase AlkD